MNLYEIKNMETGQIVASTVLLKEAAKLLDCPAYAISNAYHSNYAIYGKYKINQVDTTLTKKSLLWAEWDLWRIWFLKLCRR